VSALTFGRETDTWRMPKNGVRAHARSPPRTLACASGHVLRTHNVQMFAAIGHVAWGTHARAAPAAAALRPGRRSSNVRATTGGGARRVVVGLTTARLSGDGGSTCFAAVRGCSPNARDAVVLTRRRGVLASRSATAGDDDKGTGTPERSASAAGDAMGGGGAERPQGAEVDLGAVFGRFKEVATPFWVDKSSSKNARWLLAGVVALTLAWGVHRHSQYLFRPSRVLTGVKPRWVASNLCILAWFSRVRSDRALGWNAHVECSCSRYAVCLRHLSAPYAMGTTAISVGFNFLGRDFYNSIAEKKPDDFDRLLKAGTPWSSPQHWIHAV